MCGADDASSVTILKHSFSTDTSSNIAATLSVATNVGTGFANSGTL